MEPLIRAILEGDAASFDALVAQGADLGVVTPVEHWTLLHRALVSLAPGAMPSAAIVRRLIGGGVDVNATDREGYVPLHFAARAGHAEIVRELLSAGAEVDPENADGHTPLRLALAHKPVDAAVIEVLLAHGADMDRRPRGGGLSARRYAETTLAHEAPRIVALFDRYAAARD